jgi:hypothetical protein
VLIADAAQDGMAGEYKSLVFGARIFSKPKIKFLPTAERTTDPEKAHDPRERSWPFPANREIQQTKHFEPANALITKDRCVGTVRSDLRIAELSGNSYRPRL